jgi:hypothetical protein
MWGNPWQPETPSSIFDALEMRKHSPKTERYLEYSAMAGGLNIPNPTIAHSAAAKESQ